MNWKKFKDIATVLCKSLVSLRRRENIYKRCIGALCYGAECWT